MVCLCHHGHHNESVSNAVSQEEDYEEVIQDPEVVIEQMKAGMRQAMKAIEEQEAEIAKLEASIGEKDEEIARLKDQLLTAASAKADTASAGTTTSNMDTKTAETATEPASEVTTQTIATSPTTTTHEGASTSSEEIENLREEVSSLQARNEELEKKVAELEKKLAVPVELPSTGRKLQHATKARASGPRARSSRASRADSERSISTEDGNLRDSVAGTLDVDTSAENTTTPTESPQQTAEPTEEESTATPNSALASSPPDPQAEFRRKIANIGGVNPFAGLINPMSVQLKPRGPPTRTSSAEGLLEGLEVNEDEIREWIKDKTGEESVGKDSGVPLQSVLKNGQVLCRLINAVRPDSPIKVNTGKFSFMHMENLNNYIKSADSMGVPQNVSFTAVDLYDGTDMEKACDVISNKLLLLAIAY
ncbi:Muscle-specific protein 20 [Quaeritorhiza haematococci]|nr:Muscle-specific protein 20 [Quaeritorhiza haematococci]